MAFGSKPFASTSFAAEPAAVPLQTFDTLSASDTQTASVNAVIQQQAETVTISDGNRALFNVYRVSCSETVTCLDINSFTPLSVNYDNETVVTFDVQNSTVIPAPVGTAFDYAGIAVFADGEAPVAGSLAIAGGTTTIATINETILAADTNAAFVNVIPPPPVVVARDHDGVSHQSYPKRHKYKVPDLIAAELHRRNKLRSQIEDVMQDASYLPDLLGRSNKIVQLPAKAARSVVPKLDRLPSSPQRISDLSKLIVSLRHRSPNDDEEAMNLILQNLWKP
jgi:hypothetical protein